MAAPVGNDIASPGWATERSTSGTYAVGRKVYPVAFDRYRDHPIGFTDATTIALMEEHRVDHLLPFDGGFDGIVDRLDPASL